MKTNHEILIEKYEQTGEIKYLKQAQNEAIMQVSWEEQNWIKQMQVYAQSQQEQMLEQHTPLKVFNKVEKRDADNRL